MKIAVIVPRYTKIGGAEAFAVETCERLSSLGGLEVHVFARRFDTGNGIIRHRIPFFPMPRPLRPIAFAFIVKNQVERGGFHVVHAHECTFSAHLTTMHGIPHSVWIRDVRRKHPGTFDRIYSWVEKKAIYNSQLIMPVSSLVLEKVKETYDIEDERLVLLHPGVNKEAFIKARMNNEGVRKRKELGIGPQEFVILFVGMNFEIKGLELVIKALGELKKGNIERDIKLVIVGKGDQERYMRLAHELGIEREVRFAGERKDIPSFCCAADAFLMPSIFDTFGIAVLEAMAAGIPPIISSNVGAKDLIRHRENGFIVGGRDAIFEICAYLKLLITDRPLRERMGRLALNTAEENTWEKVVERLLRIYQSVQRLGDIRTRN